MQDQSLHPVKIFYCYAPEDQSLQEELSRHLISLRRRRDITTWVDRDIQPGAEWQREQDVHLGTADLLLLLISADFMASDYCYTVGMKRALERHRAGTAHVIPILLRPVEWEKTPLGGLSALPTDKRPVTQWADRDAAWLNIVQGIQELIRTLLPKNLLSPQAAAVLYPEQEISPRQITGQQPTGRLLHQRYRLLHAVGQGGMGAVYVAQDTQLGDRLVAVKEMSTSRLSQHNLPQAVEQFRQEAHLLASLHHPNLPVIHEYFREDDRWYLVMSFIEGQNLQAALNAAPGNRLLVNEVVRIGLELCEVLEYLHTHEPQVIFRDLKPLNIMLTPKGHICLIDFGIARHFKQEQIKDTTYYYSVGYAPPEQYGQSQTGPRSDIYSLGATLHQMLTGHNPASKPFQFSNVQLVDPAIPMPLAKLIAQMLEMSEQARPASVTEVKAQLENVLDSTAIPKTGAAKPGQVESKRKSESDKTTSPQKAALTGGPTGGFWGRVDTFFSQRRQVMWIGFIVLSLILGGILPLLSWFIWYINNNNEMLFPLFVISNVSIANYPPYVTIIGAIGAATVGLLFLRSKKRQPLLEILGNIVLGGIGFANLVLSHYDLHDYFYGESHDNYYDNRDYYSAFVIQHYFNIFIFLALFSLWLFVGTRFYLRNANRIGSWLWGTLLIIGAIALLWPEGIFTLSWLALLPALLCGVSGIAAIVVAFGNKIEGWRKIDRFLSKRRRGAWICFMVLSLILGGILPLLTWSLIQYHFDNWATSPFAISNSWIDGGPPYITMIGAVGAAGIGLLFLRLKRRTPFFEILGSITLSGIAFANLALSQYYYYASSFDYTPYYYAYYHEYYVWFLRDYPHVYFDLFFFLSLFSLWLFIGTRFFLRSANMTGRLLLGTLLVIGGIALLWPLGQFFLSPFTVLPALICEVCGAIALSVALFKRKLNTQSV